MTKCRFNEIDWAKSICMFLVVLGHCHIQPSLQLIPQVIYSFHIPLFFFLSGLLCPKKISMISIKKDIKYIMVPYFVYGTLQTFIHSILVSDFSFHYFLSNLTALFIGVDSSIGAIWFLPALFICKQLFLLFQWIVRDSPVGHLIALIVSLLSSYFISQSHFNLPLFADSALIGLPFFLIGSKCLSLICGENHKNTFTIYFFTVTSFVLTIILSKYNGFVSVAICNYGSHFSLFVLNAMTGIGTVIGICIILRHYHNTFVLTTSYGTIVTLGLHGIILLFLQYYIPQYIGYYTPSINLALAFIYSSITFIICFLMINWGDCYCPQLLGLKGNLLRYEIIPKNRDSAN